MKIFITYIFIRVTYSRTCSTEEEKLMLGILNMYTFMMYYQLFKVGNICTDATVQLLL